MRHHLLLPHTATRRDLDDPVTIDRVRDTLGECPDPMLLLDLLVALAEADGLATGPGAWTAWKQRMLTELDRRVRAVLAGRALPGPEPVGHRAVALAEAGRVAVRYDGEPDAAPETLTVTVVAPDQPGVLSAAAGVLALHSLRVNSATVAAHAGMAVDTFAVSPRFGSAPNSALLRQDLVRALDGGLDLARRLADKERDYAPLSGTGAPDPGTEMSWFDEEASGAAVGNGTQPFDETPPHDPLQRDGRSPSPRFDVHGQQLAGIGVQDVHAEHDGQHRGDLGVGPGRRAASFRPEIEINGIDTRVLVEQLTVIDPQVRIGEFAGRLYRPEMHAVDAALQAVLALG